MKAEESVTIIAAEVVQTLTIEEVYQSASCSDHPLNVSPAEIEGAVTIDAIGSCSCFPPTRMNQQCDGYCDSSSLAIGQLRDGRYILIAESSDSSGHGCQCSGACYVRESLADIYRELDQEQRSALPPKTVRLLTDGVAE